MAVVTADDAAIRDAADLLRAGKLVAFPTETVYGLGADATNGRAVASIFEAKGRPKFNPLIVHVEDLTAAERIAEFDDRARTLGLAFWPGPLALVLRRRPESGISDLVTAGLETVAVRVPDHAIAQSLLKAVGRPLAAPSANRSGHVSPTCAEHVASDFGDTIAMILDGGPCKRGLESTVIDATAKILTLLRPGALAAAEIERRLSLSLDRALDVGARPTSPGQLASHYAPNARLRLNAIDLRPGEALLAFGPNAPAAKGPIINLSPAGDLIEAAANLFAGLRSLDATGTPAIAVMPIPSQGLGEAINDSLRRAAAPRG